MFKSLQGGGEEQLELVQAVLALCSRDDTREEERHRR